MFMFSVSFLLFLSVCWLSTFITMTKANMKNNNESRATTERREERKKQTFIRIMKNLQINVENNTRYKWQIKKWTTTTGLSYKIVQVTIIHLACGFTCKFFIWTHIYGHTLNETIIFFFFCAVRSSFHCFILSHLACSFVWLLALHSMYVIFLFCIFHFFHFVETKIAILWIIRCNGFVGSVPIICNELSNWTWFAKCLIMPCCCWKETKKKWKIFIDSLNLV